ncbi:antitoxin AF2212-like protein [Thermovibrio sp.]
MKTVKVVFRNGAFYPIEEVSIPEGAEGVVVYLEEARKELPKWWSSLDLEERKKGALANFVERLRRRIAPTEVKAVFGEGGLEVFVITEDSVNGLKAVMEEALKVYEESSVYLPVQVISPKKLERWREQGSKVYEQVVRGVSLL